MWNNGATILSRLAIVLPITLTLLGLLYTAIIGNKSLADWKTGLRHARRTITTLLSIVSCIVIAAFLAIFVSFPSAGTSIKPPNTSSSIAASTSTSTPTFSGNITPLYAATDPGSCDKNTAAVWSSFSDATTQITCNPSNIPGTLLTRPANAQHDAGLYFQLKNASLPDDYMVSVDISNIQNGCPGVWTRENGLSAYYLDICDDGSWIMGIFDTTGASKDLATGNVPVSNTYHVRAIAVGSQQMLIINNSLNIINDGTWKAGELLALTVYSNNEAVSSAIFSNFALYTIPPSYTTLLPGSCDHSTQTQWNNEDTAIGKEVCTAKGLSFTDVVNASNSLAQTDFRWLNHSFGRDYTVEADISKPIAGCTGFATRQSNVQSGYYTLLCTDGNWYIFRSDITGKYTQIDKGPLATRTTHHLVAVADGENQYISVDGNTAVAVDNTYVTTVHIGLVESAITSQVAASAVISNFTYIPFPIL